MSLTQGINPKAYMSQWLDTLVQMYSVDIEAIPDDKWTMTFGGCTRPASDLTVDALGLLKWTTETFAGPVDPNRMESLRNELNMTCATRAGAKAELQKSAEAFKAALEAASEDQLSSMITAPWGMDAPLFAIVQVAVNHLWYHDGQLNYVHCLLGDDKVHWMM